MVGQQKRIGKVVGMLALFLLVQAVGAAPQDEGDQETIDLTITVKDEADAPIADAPIEIGTKVEASLKLSDASGEITFSIK